MSDITGMLLGIGILLIFFGSWYFLRSSKPKPPNADQRPAAPSSTRPAARSRVAPTSGQHFKWPARGEFEFEVVGESHYQKAIARLAGDHSTDGADVECVAELRPEDNNRYDPKAVAVKIQGNLVGYLARDDARSFRRRLGQKGLAAQVTTCDARIVGGMLRNGEKWHYGVRLDIKPFD